jgi:hypothetical protein
MTFRRQPDPHLCSGTCCTECHYQGGPPPEVSVPDPIVRRPRSASAFTLRREIERLNTEVEQLRAILQAKDAKIEQLIIQRDIARRDAGWKA